MTSEPPQASAPSHQPSPIRVRPLELRDYDAIERLCQVIYPTERPYTMKELETHHALFPEGQLVAESVEHGTVSGTLASLIIRWDDYRTTAPWSTFTAGGSFANHDARHGRTLYIADMMTDPALQHHGIAHALAAEAIEVVKRRGLLRKRGGSRLPGYHLHASTMTPRQYVRAVVRGELHDPTLSFHLHQGFKVFGVVRGYLPHDDESRGWAALTEWVNPRVASPEQLQEHQRAEAQAIAGDDGA
ncbi:MAG: GNAT family N-acetyltransferase [Phycisphaeraceae bacterium]|nr:GNAT family N-acetyltransferase [Phycisphaeraceae bacterium]